MYHADVGALQPVVIIIIHVWGEGLRGPPCTVVVRDLYAAHTVTLCTVTLRTVTLRSVTLRSVTLRSVTLRTVTLRTVTQ